MQNSRRLSFESRVMTELRANYPERLKNVEDETLRADVRTGTQRAQTFGIKDDAFVVKFLGFIVEYGSDFAETEETAWAREILKDDFLTEEEKLKALSRQRTLELMEANHAL